MKPHALRLCIGGALAASCLALPAFAGQVYVHSGETLRQPGQIVPLSGPQAGEPSTIATDFLWSHRDDLGLSERDLSEMEVSSAYTSRGLTHIYFQQTMRGIPVEGAVLNINIAADGRVLSLGNRFLPDLPSSVNGATPSLGAVDAALAASDDLGLGSASFVVLNADNGATQRTLLSDGGVSDSDVPAHLIWVPLAVDEVRLAWKVELDIVAKSNIWQMYIDAHEGDLLEQRDLVIHDEWGKGDLFGNRAINTPPIQGRSDGNDVGGGPQYEVFEIPAEYPYENNDPSDPGDDVPAGDPDGGRSIVVDPADAVASPFGWHDTDGAPGAEFTTPRGNNVHAYLDRDANNSPDAGEPDGGATLDFTGALVPLDLINDGPAAYGAASAVNLFYWNNLNHDIFYRYGFDEASGNFQENNYGNGGAGSDSVNAEAQDGAGTNNANFSTPSDGSNPRMQMFTWTTTTPNRDGDFSSGIITHEYGHGVSNRLTGGPGNVGCLNNSEQMGEGWSDWLGLVLTANAGDVPTTVRGLGTYALGQPPDTGPGIRPAPYTTDMAINSFTYGNTTGGLSVPHGIGFVWSTIIWEVYNDLVTEYGFNPDLYGDHTTGGNNLAIQLVMDGMKLQACNPGFVDGRDAILMADVNLTGGANECLLWKAFARRGLGESASQGSSGSNTDNTEAFDFPVACDFLGATPDTVTVCAGEDAVYDVVVGGAFAAPITMSTIGAPAGTSSAFDPNPVMTAPGATQLTVSGTGGLAAGTYNFDIRGDDTSTTFDLGVALDVFDMAPGAVTLTAPADAEMDVSTNPTFTWTAAPNGGTYSIEIATDAGFSNIIESASNLDVNSYSVATGLDTAITYYWRVATENPCGTEPFTAAFSFTTEVGPGDCPIGVTPALAFEDDFEAGEGGWTHSAGQGIDTWGLASDRVRSGVNSFHADDIDSVSDQYLVSPPTALPAGGSPLTMRFWNYQEIEDSGAGCFDAAVVEISTDGTTWIRLEAELLTDPYDGAVSTGFSNPIGGENAWCGDPQDWLQSVVDIDAWAGQTVQFRFRLATDSSVDHPGWWIDDVTVQSCLSSGIFADGFESGDTSAWGNTNP